MAYRIAPSSDNCYPGTSVRRFEVDRMQKHYTVDELREIVSCLAAKYGVQRIYLFGSYARGDSNEQSDIDLRIDKGAVRGLAVAGLLIDLEDALGVPVDLIPTGSLDQIHDDEVLLYEAS